MSVKGMHVNRTNVKSAEKGNSVTLNIKNVNKKDPELKTSKFKKGMKLIGLTKGLVPSKGNNPFEKFCVREFDAEVMIFHHATTIQKNYQAVIHCGNIRQTAKALSITTGQNNDSLRTGDKGLIRFKFQSYPECIKEGQTIMFREGKTIGIGNVVKVYHGT